MSELEKTIDQKLADARKQSEITATAQKTTTKEVKIKQEPETESKGGDKKVDEGGKSKKVEPGSGSKKSVDDRKDRVESGRSGGDRKDDARKGSSGDSRRGSGSDKRDGNRRESVHDRKDDSSRSNRSRAEHDDRRRGTSTRDREEPSRNGSKSTRADDRDKKDNDKAKDDRSKEAGKEKTSSEESKKKRDKVTINDGADWDTARGDEEKGKEERSEDWQVLSEDRASKEKEKSRERSPTPPWSTRYKGNRGRRYQNEWRSPSRRRSRSREVSRRRSRSPGRNRSRSPRHRRSPSTYSRSYRAPSRRYSPRRSRSPVRRRSRSRSRISPDRGPNPKALLAKKSFLDDLAVKFAQEGKEFPELEQYRCEINNQFGTGSYMPHTMENVPGFVGGAYAPPPPAMGMPVMCGDGMYDEPYPMTTPEYVDTPPLVAYPIAAAAALAKPSPPVMIPLEDIMSSVRGTSSKGSSAIETIMPENKVAVSDLLMSKKSSLGSLPEPVAEKGFVWRGDAKTRISQAIELLDDMERAVQRSGKFMYRSQTYYETNIDENRSPMLQGPNNPRFSFNAPPGESNDPFGNIPKNIKPVIKALCLDEGKISEQIFLRTRRQQLAATLKKKKQEMEERKKRYMVNISPKAQLQKTTQTDPTVCTECLIRKLKFRATAETQTVPVRTTDSVVQTNPMPVQTVTEFGSITELTPNQVRAVSELIKYIKLTATTGSAEEMRNSMLRNQMYNVNGDLRNAYQYFDAMVDYKSKGQVAAVPQQQPPQEIIEAIDDEPPIEEIIYEDDAAETIEENWDDEVDEIDEYEQYHRTFGDDGEDIAPVGGGGQMFGHSTNNQYQDPKSSFQNNPLAPRPYGDSYSGGRGGLSTGRGKFNQPRGGRGRGGKKNARGGKAASWK